MSTKVEPHSTTANMSVASSGTKISFSVKKGFVIPKNKLSGSLVPTFRGAKKGATSDVAEQESNKQLQRKTKWGPDLAQDPAIRKARALAYQTRVDQITEQLKSGFLETEDSQEPLEASRNSNFESSIHQKSELLELERREAIGEILKLNPSYKPPSDYKPLMKEAKVHVPTKEYPGHNFIGVLSGPSSDTLKQLEKETGAKIRVYGTKANSRDKGEIIPAEANESHGAYEELYVHISADTYEKVDAAVSLIEMLIKQVLVNQASVSTPPTSVSADDAKVGDQTQVTMAPNTVLPAGVNQKFLQQTSGPAQAPPQAQFQQYTPPWFSQGPPQPLTNIPNNPPFFGPRPVAPNNFTPQGQFGLSTSHPQPSPTGFSPVARPPGPSLGPLSVPPHGPYPHPTRPNLSGSAPFTNVPPHMSSFTPNQGGTIPSPSPLVPPVSTMSAPPPPPPLQARTPNSYPGNAPAPNSYPGNAPTPNSYPGNAPAPNSYPGNAPTPNPYPGNASTPNSYPGNAPTPNPYPGNASTPNSYPGNAPTPNSYPGNAPSFTPLQNPPNFMAQKEHRPNLDNFTFQPQRPQNPPSQPGPRPMMQNNMNQNQPFQQNMQNPSAQEILEALLRPLLNQTLNQFPQFPENSNFRPQRGPRNNHFPGPHSSRGHREGPRNFNTPFPRRPGNSFHQQHNFPPTNRPNNFYDGNNASTRRNSRRGTQQVYDPFSPTAVSNPPTHEGNLGNTRKQEDDPEYENLMNSVGLK